MVLRCMLKPLQFITIIAYHRVVNLAIIAVFALRAPGYFNMLIFNLICFSSYSESFYWFSNSISLAMAKLVYIENPSPLIKVCVFIVISSLNCPLT